MNGFEEIEELKFQILFYKTGGICTTDRDFRSDLDPI